MVLLPFDAHNHVHMGSSSPSLALQDTLCGMAVMSTHPRDFPVVINLARDFSEDDDDDGRKTIVPCMGVHPWFLHELTQEDWEQPGGDTSSSFPRWVSEIESLLQTDTSIAVGEIGLDNFHFNDPVTKELSTALKIQMLAMEYQLDLATHYQRPVSVHCVRAMGPMLEVFNKVLNKKRDTKHKVPPRIYFHAFGGKAATVIQLIRLLEPKPKKQKKKKKNHANDDPPENQEEICSAIKPEKTPSSSSTITPKVYFGFAPIVNFQSPKTLDVIRAVGLERLVLETDHEEAYKVPTTMKEGLRVISETFGITQDELIEITNQNAQDLYLMAEDGSTS